MRRTLATGLAALLVGTTTAVAPVAAQVGADSRLQVFFDTCVGAPGNAAAMRTFAAAAGWQPADATAAPLAGALGWFADLRLAYPQATAVPFQRGTTGGTLYLLVLDVPETGELVCQVYDFAATAYDIEAAVLAWLGAQPLQRMRNPGIAADYWFNAPGLPGLGVSTTFVAADSPNRAQANFAGLTIALERRGQP